MVFLHFLAPLLQSLLELVKLLAQLHKVLLYGIDFLTAFLSGTKIGFLLSVFLIPTTIPGIVHGVHAPMPLAQVAKLLEMGFLGNPGHRLGTRRLLHFLPLVRSFLRRFQLGLLVCADALDFFK